ncbi:MAG TPA: hypothetical protein VHP37_19720 [Burkholderiales bacterium]|nr:hypothetical protein [Burkholderiales bacterium]
MSAIARRPEADPLYTRPAPERASYATGMLLDAQDFTDEQTYHRGRLARALALFGGGGTLGGLEVKHRPAQGKKPEEIEVSAGAAIDRLGRLVELQRPACLRLQVWFDGEKQRDGGDTLQRATLTDLGRFVSERVENAGGLPARAVVADVFVRFIACERGLTPSFASGPFDALDAVAASRVRDAYELHLVPRDDGLDGNFSGLPSQGPDLVSIADLDARRAALQDAMLAAYPKMTGDGKLEPPPGHPPELDPTAVFLARVLIPVNTSKPPGRTKDAPIVDNYSRRFIPTAELLSRFVGG